MNKTVNISHGSSASSSLVLEQHYHFTINNKWLKNKLNKHYICTYMNTHSLSLAVSPFLSLTHNLSSTTSIQWMINHLMLMSYLLIRVWRARGRGERPWRVDMGACDAKCTLSPTVQWLGLYVHVCERLVCSCVGRCHLKPLHPPVWIINKTDLVFSMCAW